MTNIEVLLRRWRSSGVLEGDAIERILAWEAEQTPSAGLRWQGVVALTLGSLLLATGVILFVSAHWDQIGPGARFALVLGMVAAVHLAGGIVREGHPGLSSALHAVGTIATGAAIGLVGQIFNIEEHWPAAVLLWAIAAFAGWALLRDQAQQTLALLLGPAWLFCELRFSTANHIGQHPYLGRFLLVWAISYLTLFLNSRRKVVHGVLFAAAALAGLVGIWFMMEGGPYWSASQTVIPFQTRFWAWVAIAVLPLAIAAFKGHWGLIPPSAALVTAILLPLCQHLWTYRFSAMQRSASMTMHEPHLAAHGLVGAFALFMIVWGFKQASRGLVNLGMVYFAIAVGWFYFSNIFDKVERSLGLIGLGVLFLAGGWLLEKTRRRLLARMNIPLGSGMEEA